VILVELDLSFWRNSDLSRRNWRIDVIFVGSLYGWGSCANGVLGNGRKVGSLDRPKRVKAGNIVWRYRIFLREE
jgi:hypothetical protein